MTTTTIDTKPAKMPKHMEAKTEAAVQGARHIVRTFSGQNVAIVAIIAGLLLSFSECDCQKDSPG